MNISLSRRRFQNFLASPLFFKLIVGLLVVQALWIACTGRYPMAFDEDFHLGIIKLYAGHINPFWSAHPAGADAYGAVTRDPSYLYHYLMSFPYRIIRLFTSDQTIQVMCLRLINIVLFAGALPLYRRLLRRIGASHTVINFVLLLFVLIPIVPLLAAQINYDNLSLPLTALSLLLTLRFLDSLQARRFDIAKGVLLLAVCLLSSLVKYAYLPVFAGLGIYVLIRLWRAYHTIPAVWSAARDGGQYIVGWQRWALAGLLIVAVVLFSERVGVNVVRYHTPAPDCAQVLLYDQCQHYGPWIRDYNFAQSKAADADKSPVHYTQHWLYGMWFRSFFAVDGPTTGFQTRGPLALPGITGVIGAVIATIAILFGSRRVWRRYNTTALWLISITSGLYILVLWLTEYQLFVQTSVPVAINGRYLIPILPGLLTIAALAFKELVRLPYIRYSVAVVLIVGLTWGGGALTYILRSNDAWYWPGTPFKTANHTVQRIVGPITPGYRRPMEYLH